MERSVTDVERKLKIDILPAPKGEDSPTGSSRSRVSSVLEYAFAWNVSGRLTIVTPWDMDAKRLYRRSWSVRAEELR